MNGLKKLICVMICMCVVIGGGESVSAISSNIGEIQEEKTFEYPITPDDVEWQELDSVEAKIEACRISQEILDSMTNEQLLEAIMDFPFLIDVYAAQTESAGVESLERICDAYRELLSRNDAKNFLMEKVYQKSKTRSSNISVMDEIKNNALTSLVLYQDDFSGTLSNDEVIALVDLSTSIVQADDEISRELIYQGTVETPNGSDVAYYYHACEHSNSNFHVELAEEYAIVYGIVVIHPGNCRYNCHSYAWYSTSTGNLTWINDPSPYMLDGSYSNILSGIQTNSLPVGSGDIVFYGTLSNPTHSARIVEAGTASKPLATIYVYSKWGSAGLYKHRVTNVPEGYDESNVTVWHPEWEEEE